MKTDCSPAPASPHRHHLFQRGTHHHVHRTVVTHAFQYRLRHERGSRLTARVFRMTMQRDQRIADSCSEMGVRARQSTSRIASDDFVRRQRHAAFRRRSSSDETMSSPGVLRLFAQPQSRKSPPATARPGSLSASAASFSGARSKAATSRLASAPRFSPCSPRNIEQAANGFHLPAAATRSRASHRTPAVRPDV